MVLCILAGYLNYSFKYRIDSKMYAQILAEREARGDINLKN